MASNGTRRQAWPAGGPDRRRPSGGRRRPGHSAEWCAGWRGPASPGWRAGRRPRPAGGWRSCGGARGARPGGPPLPQHPAGQLPSGLAGVQALPAAAQEDAPRWRRGRCGRRPAGGRAGAGSDPGRQRRAADGDQAILAALALADRHQRAAPSRRKSPRSRFSASEMRRPLPYRTSSSAWSRASTRDRRAGPRRGRDIQQPAGLFLAQELGRRRARLGGAAPAAGWRDHPPADQHRKNVRSDDSLRAMEMPSLRPYRLAR